MLKPKKRITRKQIKEDKLVTLTAQVTDYYRRNSRNLLAGAGILVVLIVVVVFYFNSRAQAESEATYDLTMAKIDIGQRNYDTAAQKLTALIDTYGGTKSAGDAVFFLGNVKLSTNDWDAAIKEFQKYIDKYHRDPLFTAGAIAGIGFAYEQQQKYSEAAEYYMEAANKYPHQFSAPRYLLDAGRCYGFGGNPVKAHEAFQKIIDQYPESSQIQKAKDELNRW
jgi:TolA-binding protein